MDIKKYILTIIRFLKKIRKIESWNFERIIVNQSGERTVASGTATFTPRNGELHYHEQGTLYHKNPITFEQEYIYLINIDSCEVLFKDRRHFHMIQEGVKHCCGNDVYEPVYYVNNNIMF